MLVAWRLNRLVRKLPEYWSMVLDAWSLPLDAYMTLLPLMVLKEPHNCINLLEARTRCTLWSAVRAAHYANDLVLIP